MRCLVPISTRSDHYSGSYGCLNTWKRERNFIRKLVIATVVACPLLADGTVITMLIFTLESYRGIVNN